MPVVRGESAVVVPVPAVEPVVSGWRERYDGSAAAGMPAHITVLYPFLAEHQLTPAVRAQLREVCAAIPPQNVVFGRTARFPDVLYFPPEPADGFQRLTGAMVERWPEAPPYGGAFAQVIPHLTIAHGQSEEVLGQVDAELRRHLPVQAHLREACLFAFNGERWHLQEHLPFRAPAPSGSRALADA